MLMMVGRWFAIPLLSVLLFQGTDSCDGPPEQSASGVNKVTTAVPTGPDGLTVEQRNVRDRLLMDNKPGSIKYLYVISAYSGQVLIYSTVKGKVTSSGKRLTPVSANYSSNSNGTTGLHVNLPNGDALYTNEVLQDDGTYGTSVDYLYWWDVQGRYHQLYPTGGQIITLSDQPLPVKSITLNFEETKAQ